MYIHVYIYVYIEIPQVLKETLQGKHSLLAAAAVGNVQAVSEHIAKGADLRARNLHGRTALMLACLSAKKKRKTKDDEEEDEEDDEKSGGDDDEGEEGGGDDDDEEMRKQQAEEVAALLITPTGAAGALDAVDNDGMSSLMAARKNGLDDIVKMLLKAGAKPDLTDKKGSTAAGHPAGKTAGTSKPKKTAKKTVADDDDDDEEEKEKEEEEEEEEEEVAMSLAGKTLVFTGTLGIDRKTATQQAEAAGAKVTGAVSAKTTHLVAGPGAGSKVAAAEAKGVTIWTENDFLAAVGVGGGASAPKPKAAAPKPKPAKKAAASKTAAAGKRKAENDDADDDDDDDDHEAATEAPAKKSKGKAPAAPAAASSSKKKSLAGKVLVFTGTLNTNRKKATTMAEAAGAKVTGSVSGTTTHLVAGPGAGSKVAAAEAKGVTIWTEDDFLAAIGGN